MKRVLARTVAACTLFGMACGPALAEVGAYIAFDAKTGEVFAKYHADQAWYPASVTKLMTTYVTFQSIKAGRLKFTSPVIMSAQAASQPPSKMGFPVGTVITVDNALKMIMVKSANDVAWALGETVGGSKAAFVAEMNAWAAKLGMTESNWGNPNGLPDPSQVTTARDLGILAKALLAEFPSYDYYYRLPGIQLGNRIVRNHNHLLDHYPGSDGMKTGFICAGGYNVVATATRDGKRVVVVVLGAPGTRPRAEKAAMLFDRAFEGTGFNLFAMAGGKETIDTMKPGPEASLPVQDVRKDVCGGKHHEAPPEDLGDEETAAQDPNAPKQGAVIIGGQLTAAQRRAKGSLLATRFDIGPPVKVWIGGADSIAARTATLSPDVEAPATSRTPPSLVPIRQTAAPTAPVQAPGSLLQLKQPSGPPTQVTPALEPAPETMHPLVRAFSIFDPKPAAAAEAPSPVDSADERKPNAPAAAISASLPLPTPKPVHAAASKKPAAPTAHPKAAVPKPKKKPEPAQ